MHKSENESEVAQLCPTLCNPMDCSLPGSSVGVSCIYYIFSVISPAIRRHDYYECLLQNWTEYLYGILHEPSRLPFLVLFISFYWFLLPSGVISFHPEGLHSVFFVRQVCEPWILSLCLSQFHLHFLEDSFAGHRILSGRFCFFFSLSVLKTSFCSICPLLFPLWITLFPKYLMNWLSLPSFMFFSLSFNKLMMMCLGAHFCI